MIYLEIFLCYFQIGLFGIGGGHASLPLVQAMVVKERGWLTFTEFADMITIAEMTPGPLALNTATFVGLKMGGAAGGALATMSCMLPSFIIVLLLYTLFKRYKDLKAVSGALAGIKPAVTALIAGAGVSLTCLALFGTNKPETVTEVDPTALILTVAAFIVLRVKKVNYVAVMLLTGVAGAVIYTITGVQT